MKRTGSVLPLAYRAESGRLRFALHLSYNGEDNSSHTVAEGHNYHVKEGFSAPHVGNGEVIHVCHAVLEAAEDKDRHAHEYSYVSAEIIWVVPVIVHGYEHQNSAEDGENKDAQKIVIELRRADRHRLFSDSGYARCAHEVAHGARPNQIAEPDAAQKTKI